MGIQRKKKPCKICEKVDYIFSEGRCKPCSQKAYTAKALEKKKEKQQKDKESNKDGYPPIVFTKRRTPIKRTPIKRTPIKKSYKRIKQKQISKVPTKKHIELKAKERAAMEKVWKSNLDFEDRCHCAECGCDIGGDTMNPFSVAHIISKGSNTALRTDLRNMILLCPDHHTEFDCEARSTMDVFDETEEIRQQLNLEYHTK